MCIFIPVVFGFPQKIKAIDDKGIEKYELREQGWTQRQCPNCHNHSTNACKSRRWFELFWIPLVPMTKDYIWYCSICGYKVDIAKPMAKPVQGQQPQEQNQQQQQQQQSHNAVPPTNKG